MKKIKIYFAHALSDASAEFLVKMDAMKRRFEGGHPQCEILHFFGLGPSAKDGKILEYDLEKVGECDLLVCIADGYGVGIGVELCERFRVVHKPGLILAHADWKKTRAATGWPDLYPDLALLRRYDNVQEIIGLIDEALDHFNIRAA